MSKTTQEVLIDFKAKTSGATADINKVNSELDKVGNSAEKQSKKFSASTKSVGKFYAKLLGGAAAFRAMYSATKDNIQATAKLNAILKATKGVAGITKASMRGITKELQDYTGETKATIKNTAAMLLTFKNINKDVFPDTMKVTADLAAAMGTDLKSAAIQVGKAMNDPATGMTALTRSGITFTDAQKKLIKSFQATNQLGKAQAIILKELQSQFGGTAAAMNATPIGQVETAMNQFKDTLADIGKVILPVFGAIMGAIGGLVRALFSASPAIKAVAAAIAVAIGALTGPVGLVISLVGAIGLLGSMSKTLDDIRKDVEEVTNGFNDLSKQDKLMSTLKGLKKGTKEYETTLKQIVKLNPKLASSNLQAMKSYNDIAAAVQNASNKQKEYLQGLAGLQRDETTNLIRKKIVGLVFSSASTKDMKLLSSAFRTLGQTAVYAGGAVNRYWAQNSDFIKSLQADGKLVAGTYNNLLTQFKKGRDEARKMLRQGQQESRKITSPNTQIVTNKTKAAKKAIFDLEKYRYDLQLERAGEFEKRRLQAEREFQQTKSKIEKAFADKTLSLAKKKNGIELAAARKAGKINAINAEQQKRLAEQRKTEIVEYAQTVSSEVSSTIASGDATSSIVSLLNSSGNAYAQMAAMAISTISKIAGSLSHAAYTAAEQFKMKMDALKIGESITTQASTILEKFLGGATEKTISGRLGSSKFQRDEMAQALGIGDISGMSKEQLKQLSKNYDEAAKLYQKYAVFVAKARADKRWSVEEELKSGEYLQKFKELGFLNMLSANAKKWFNKAKKTGGFMISKKDREALKEEIKSSGKLLEMTLKIDDLERQKKLINYQKELQKIHDDIRTGKTDEANTIDEQIILYDEMISSLNGVAGAEEVILDLQEQRFNLSKKINAENQLSAFTAGEQGKQLSILLSELENIQRGITSGAIREGTSDTVSQQVSILDGIISGLQLQGAPNEVIDQYVSQKRNLLEGLYGAQGFQARAGTGAAVGFSVPTTSGYNNTTNTTNNQLSISGQQYQGDDFISNLMDEITRRYGVNLITGA